MAKNISINDRKVRIQIWDTAGQEAYRSITRSYYKSAACVFIVYDISDKKSFIDVDLWLKDCREICFKNIIIYLIGNKNDLEEEIEVKEENINKFLENNNDFTYKSISAKREDNCVNDLFQEIAERMYERECQEGNDIRRNSVKVLSYNKGPRKKCVFIKCLS